MSCPGCGGGKCFLVALGCVFLAILSVLFGHIYFVLNDEVTSGSVDAIRRNIHPLDNVAPFPGAANNNILWFVQLTDLHLSRYRGLPSRLDHFRKFLSNDVDILKPDVLILTGDLTDAKDITRQGSAQYEDEWLMYRAAIEDSGVLNKTTFLDVRGNHDAFNIPYLEHEGNLYAKYSVKGQKHLRSYLHLHKTSFGQYAFIGVDACPDPGIKRPFNFFGLLNNNEWTRLDHLKADARKSNSTIWFGHYPSSVVLSTSSRQFKTLIGDGLVYLCGHLHTLGGLVTKLHTIQKSGSLELELGDWLDNRIYRILAIDHDILSFTDEVYNKWPVVLITNPAHSAFLMPGHEPTGRIQHSTHIRILAFSPNTIMSVKVWINGVEIGEAQSAGKSLYTLPWQPKNYLKGLHTIKVHVIDAKANEKQVEQSFTLDPVNNKHVFPMFPRFLLMSNASTFLKLLFITVWLMATVPLVGLHIYGHVLRGPVQCGGAVVSYVRRWYHHYLVLSRCDTLFYPLVLFDLYLALGPWFIGFVMDEYIGISFVYGVFVMGQLLPMHTTLAYGIIQLVTFNIPLTAVLAATADGGMVRKTLNHRKFITILTSVFSIEQSLFWFIICFQIVKCVASYLSYGLMATLISPMVLWPIVFAFVMRRRARCMRRQLSTR